MFLDDGATTTLSSIDGGADGNGVSGCAFDMVYETTAGWRLICGESYDGTDQAPTFWEQTGSSPFTWTVYDLDMLSGDTTGVGRGINNDLLIVGQSGTSAVVWENGTGYTWTIEELPYLSGDTTGIAMAVNDDGRVVGQSGTTAVYWEEVSGTWTVFDLINTGIVLAVNSDGFMVGEAGGSAALWNGMHHNISKLVCDDTNWSSFEEATGISDDDLIVGWGIRNGHEKPFALTGSAPGSCPGDVDADGDIDVSDLMAGS
jgi:hypothetical protein